MVNGVSPKRKLLIIAPPGHAKSTWISLVFPPWYLGQHPDHSLLFLTSSDTAAHQFGTTVKMSLAENARHDAAFPDGPARPDTDRGWSADGLYLAGTPSGSKDPAYRAVGYGASVIGARAHGIIVDDPLTQAQAQSAVEQVKAKQYHDMTVDSRLHPDGWEIAIMTRWHDLDLASHLMSKPGWSTLLMPALGYYGEDAALWPERFPLETLQATRQDIGGPLFSCMYQGDPTSLGGQVFKESSWFQPLPANLDRSRLRIVQFWDLAYSAKSTADYTAAVTIGIDTRQNLYLLDVWRGRVEEERLDGIISAKVEEQRPALVGIEEAAYRQAATRDLLIRLVRDWKVQTSLFPVKVTTDKVFRAQLPASRAQAGFVFADRTAAWWPVFLSECQSFPLGANDDQVDALSGATQMAIEVSQYQHAPAQSYSIGGGQPKARSFSFG